MNTDQITEIIRNIKFVAHPNIGVIYGGSEWDHPEYLQLRDASLPAEFNSGRKWRLSKWMTKSEVVQTVLTAYLTWVEHEARESFKYKGVSIFGPHFDVEALVEIADRIEVR